VNLAPEEHLRAIATGIDDAREDHAIEARILLTAIRNLGAAHAIEVARYAASKPPYRRRPGRSIEDPAIVEEVAARGTVLECCPPSNVVLALFPS
jgi:adenosine deaminase